MSPTSDAAEHRSRSFRAFQAERDAAALISGTSSEGDAGGSSASRLSCQLHTMRTVVTVRLTEERRSEDPQLVCVPAEPTTALAAGACTIRLRVL